VSCGASAAAAAAAAAAAGLTVGKHQLLLCHFPDTRPAWDLLREQRRTRVSHHNRNLLYSSVYAAGAKIQMLDLPGIIEGAKDGKGRGRQVISTARTCNLILIVLDCLKPLTHKKVR
jgi:hypothetical protein